MKIEHNAINYVKIDRKLKPKDYIEKYYYAFIEFKNFIDHGELINYGPEISYRFIDKYGNKYEFWSIHSPYYGSEKEIGYVKCKIEGYHALLDKDVIEIGNIKFLDKSGKILRGEKAVLV